MAAAWGWEDMTDRKRDQHAVGACGNGSQGAAYMAAGIEKAQVPKKTGSGFDQYRKEEKGSQTFKLWKEGTFSRGP